MTKLDEMVGILCIKIKSGAPLSEELRKFAGEIVKEILPNDPPPWSLMTIHDAVSAMKEKARELGVEVE